MFTIGPRSCGTFKGLLLILSGLIIQCLPAQTPQKTERPIDTQQQEDLRILVTKVVHYEIHNATPEEAILQLWKQVLDRPPTVPIIIHPSAAKSRGVSMDVKDIPGSQILSYIAELTACDWSLRGWDANGLRLELTQIEGIDDTSIMQYGDAFMLNKEGLNTFGMTKKVNPNQVMAVLESYGLQFGEEDRRGYALYRHQDQTLTVVAPKDQLNLAQTLINLANAGKLKEFQSQ